MPIIVKSEDEIAIMREAGRHVAEVIQRLVEALRPGIIAVRSLKRHTPPSIARTIAPVQRRPMSSTARW